MVNDRVYLGTARKHLSRWVSLAGIKKSITWQCSRHSFAVNLLNSGADNKTGVLFLAVAQSDENDYLCV
ncbi:MAG: hypothetical protein K2H50_03945 [Paramuribaculum sp.]|nr:hypothetical protein [Paramuribaculum sp.]